MLSETNDRFRPRRRRTRVVRVGGIGIGGDHPIRIQSMTNTDTMDTDATVRQIVALADAGCEIVRVTAPSLREAENLREIRRKLEKIGVDVPLVADIHFTPNAAMIAAEIVDKVRINPGNYADKKRFEIREYDDAQYEAEVERVAKRFRPLVLRCKALGVAMRIGTNHGSLSDRIMNRFGDTALGMVESALEFLDVCEAENYYDVVFSMKASNTQVAIAAYRLLAERLEARAPGRPSYPFHVGVTEAGGAEDGRIKSAIGIGSLLEDGLGDTIRVSLTEDPVREVPVARTIASRAGRRIDAGSENVPCGAGESPLDGAPPPIEVESAWVEDRFAPRRRETDGFRWGGLDVGGAAPVRVELELGDVLSRPEESAARLAFELSGLTDVECESLVVSIRESDDRVGPGEFARELASLGLELPISLRVMPGDAALLNPIPREPGLRIGRLVATIDVATEASEILRLAEFARKSLSGIEWELAGAEHEIPGLVRRVLANQGDDDVPRAMSVSADASLHAVRILAAALADAGAARTPIVLRQRVDADPIPNPGSGEGITIPEAVLVDASVRLGTLLCDGIGDLVSMSSTIGAVPAVDLAYRILQGARQRTTRTEYISCPSCGRTLFDLEETTARIQARTRHLKGVKIAVMGCIVNGPGEMADADFGYVGSGPGRVTLYVGREVVARGVPEAEATDRLVDLIRDNGRWVENGDEAHDSLA